MLKIARKMNDFSFGKLMEVYEEGNLENGQDLWPEEPQWRQIALAEQEFYQYLQQVFFKSEGARYLIWEEGAISAPCGWNPTGMGCCWRRWKQCRSIGIRAMQPSLSMPL